MPLFFPHFCLNEVPPRELQAALCRSFQRWGLPQTIKVDNGKPLGDPQRTSVPVMALWLIGLGITMVWNRPRTPRDNAKVERMQQTTANWAEVQRCQDAGELQLHLDQVALLQRERYAVRRLKGKTRKQCYGALWQNPRRYHPGSFDAGRVYKYLTTVTFMRNVSKNGYFTFYAQSIYIGTRYTGQTLAIRFDSLSKNFLVSEPRQQEYRLFTADNFSPEAIQTLQVCRPRKVKCTKPGAPTIAKT